MLPYFSEKNASHTSSMLTRWYLLFESEWFKQWMKFTQLLVWIKDSAIIGRLDYLPQHELIAYGWYGKHAFYGGKAKSILPFATNQKEHDSSYHEANPTLERTCPELQ
jgi:hypothetical protein